MLHRGDIMSYDIRYDSVTTKKYPAKRRAHSNRKRILLIFGGVVAALTVAMHITAIRRLLLPGDPVVTERAIIKMVDELRAGEGVTEAFSTFCNEVIQGGIVE